MSQTWTHNFSRKFVWRELHGIPRRMWNRIKIDSSKIILWQKLYDAYRKASPTLMSFLPSSDELRLHKRGLGNRVIAVYPLRGRNVCLRKNWSLSMLGFVTTETQYNYCSISWGLIWMGDRLRSLRATWCFHRFEPITALTFWYISIHTIRDCLFVTSTLKKDVWHSCLSTQYDVRKTIVNNE
jgi:hypothetical protein